MNLSKFFTKQKIILTNEQPRDLFVQPYNFISIKI
jgi:hypothetical protein